MAEELPVDFTVTLSIKAPTYCDVAICGGGLGGLALAVGLARRGFDVRVFEAAPQVRTATSTLIGLGANSFNALSDLHPDIVPRLRERGATAKTLSTLYKPGRDAPAQEKSQATWAEMITIRWSEVQRTLVELVPPEIVHCNYKASGYTELQEEGLVRVHFKGQPDVVARLVVGADGVRSAIRACMLPTDPGPRYLGHMNWNALLHNPGGNTVVDAHTPGELQVHSDVPKSARVPFNVLVYIIDAGGGYTFWQVRTRSEQPSFTPAPGEENGDGKSESDHHLLHHDALPQLVGGGLGRPGSKARVESILDSFGMEHALKVVQATDEGAIFERAIMDRIPLDELSNTLHSKGNRVLLMGDAAHAVHPGPGQGARTAFEDACVLVTLLDKHRDELAGWRRLASKGSEGKSSEEQAAVNSPASGGDDEGVAAVAADYDEARLVRVCRVQRHSASFAGLDSVRDKVFPAHLSDEERLARGMEFGRWMDQFPKNPSGDPALTYWKPPGM